MPYIQYRVVGTGSWTVIPSFSGSKYTLKAGALNDGNQ